MLILAGVSLNAIVGDNGILFRAQYATVVSRISQLKEELEINITGTMMEEGIDNREQVTVLNDRIRKYIPSIKDDEIGIYGVVSGELYYIGEDSLYRLAAANQNINVVPEGMSLEEFKLELETMAVNSIIKYMGGDAFIPTEEEELKGIELVDKTFDNGNRWKIITTTSNTETNAVYGTGWYYVPAGNEIDNIGTLTNPYIVNYTERKAVRFDFNKHALLSFGGNIKITDGLVYNADPINMQDGSAENWGNATLVGFTGTEYNEDGITVKSGWTEHSFEFDGEDDLLMLNDNSDFSNGITLSFYGKCKGQKADRSSQGIFGKINEVSGERGLRYLFDIDKDNNIGKIFLSLSAVSIADAGTNLITGKPLTNIDDFAIIPGLEVNKDFYLDFVADPNDYTIKIYYNNELVLDGKMTPEHWQDALIGLNDDTNRFKIGKVDVYGAPDGTNSTGYFYGSIYSIRVYNKALNANELTANYNATVSYHNALVGGGDLTTGGNTDDGAIEF